MADSENSRTLPSCTHRNLLCAVEELLFCQSKQNSPAHGKDTALENWKIWQQAYTEFSQLCRLQQHLERKLLEDVGEPYIRVEVPGEGTLPVKSYKDIEFVLRGPALAEARAEAEERLKQHYSLWQVADKLSGYTRALEAESDASNREQAAARLLWETPAQSILGAIAKLHVLITLGVLSPDCDEFPWPPLRSILADMMRMVNDADVSPPCKDTYAASFVAPNKNRNKSIP